MKNYEKPSFEEESIVLEDVVALSSGGTGGLPGDDPDGEEMP